MDGYVRTRLQADDLLADRVLEDAADDAFNNWAIARRLADLVADPARR